MLRGVMLGGVIPSPFMGFEYGVEDTFGVYPFM
jgi:hypothetical protein